MNRRRRNLHALRWAGLLSTSRASVEWEQGRCHPLPGILLDLPMPFRHDRSELPGRRLGTTEPGFG